MSDNTTITPGSGATVAADNIGGALFQRVKLGIGADGSASDAVGGAGAVSAAVQRVTLASDDPAVTDLAAIEALLTGIDADTDAIKTAVQLIDNAIAGSEMQVDIVSGTLALSGEDHIGQLGGHVAVVKPTVTIDTAAYAAGDSLAGEITLTNAARTSGGSGVVTDIVLFDDDGEGASLTILLFDADPAATAIANGAFAWGAGDMARLIGIVPVATGDWITVNANKICHKSGLGIAFKAVGSANLYAHILINEIKTFTATTDIGMAVKCIQD
jgi:hypothetical protein